MLFPDPSFLKLNYMKFSSVGQFAAKPSPSDFLLCSEGAGGGRFSQGIIIALGEVRPFDDVPEF